MMRTPIVPGHEFAGEVVEVGKGVERWRPGDRVLNLYSAAGVGSAALQTAKLLGATTWAVTSSPARADELQALGASADRLRGRADPERIAAQPAISWTRRGRRLGTDNITRAALRQVMQLVRDGRIRPLQLINQRTEVAMSSETMLMYPMRPARHPADAARLADPLVHFLHTLHPRVRCSQSGYSGQNQKFEDQGTAHDRDEHRKQSTQSSCRQAVRKLSTYTRSRCTCKRNAGHGGPVDKAGGMRRQIGVMPAARNVANRAEQCNRHAAGGRSGHGFLHAYVAVTEERHRERATTDTEHRRCESDNAADAQQRRAARQFTVRGGRESKAHLDADAQQEHANRQLQHRAAQIGRKPRTTENAERQARPGSAADRRPATEPAPATPVTPDTPVTPAAPPAATPAEVAARAEVATS